MLANVATPVIVERRPVPQLSTEAVDSAQRVGVLDVLRGIALFGMILVHFNGGSQPPHSALEHGFRFVSHWFFVDRFKTMFAILFGAGFALQLGRADARGDRFIGRYLRRLLALAMFGFIAQGIFGFAILLNYAKWGVPLLLVRRWSPRALTVALVVCVMSAPLYWVGRVGYDLATGGQEKLGADSQQLCLLPYMRVPTTFNAICQPAWQRMIAAGRSRERSAVSSFGDFVRTRLARTWDSLTAVVPGAFLPVVELPLFLIGVLAIRLGVFERPGDHRRLIVSLMAFGVMAFGVSSFLYTYFLPNAASAPLAIQILASLVGLALFRDLWLAFAYIGAVLLLVARSPVWLRRLGVFGITGRMALTNYMLQVIIIDRTLGPYSLGLKLPFAFAPLAALALFGVEVAFSSWWLKRFQYGPLEWLWRSATYLRLQPMLRGSVVAVAHDTSIPRTASPTTP